jgi:hypothetical protein
MLIRQSVEADLPAIVRTINDAAWAIGFYERNGFSLVSESRKDELLKRYWSIPARQVEASVVLANSRWLETQSLSKPATSHSDTPRMQGSE